MDRKLQHTLILQWRAHPTREDCLQISGTTKTATGSTRPPRWWWGRQLRKIGEQILAEAEKAGNVYFNSEGEA